MHLVIAESPANCNNLHVDTTDEASIRLLYVPS